MDPKSNITQQMLLQLLEKSRLTEKQIETGLEKAQDPSYWKALNPHLSIDSCTTSEPVESSASDSSELEILIRRYTQAGYFQTQPVLAPAVVKKLRDCIEVLKKEDWPPVFAFVYDELWLATRTPLVERLLCGILGPGYRQTSHVWCHYVQQARGVGGWAPHVDGVREGKRVTVWMPLSDANLDNGCIYVIPRDLVASEVTDRFLNTSSIGVSETAELLQSSRALPAQAGSILGWDYTLIHWGAKCGWPSNPRISIAIGFIASDTEPSPREPPLFDGSGPPPSFAQRLRLIGKGLQTYQKREPRMIRYQELGHRLLDVETN
jgi:hypothetical protein